MSPKYSEAKLKPEQRKFIAEPCKGMRWFMLFSLELPQGFQQSIFKSQIGWVWGAVRGYRIRSWTMDWLADDEEAGWCHRGELYPSLGSRRPMLQHTRLPCLSPTPGPWSNTCSLNWWCHPTISSSVLPVSSRLQSFPASESFPMSQFFASGGQSTRVSALASVLPMNIQDWFPLELIGLISFQSKGLSRVFSNTTVQKHQFFLYSIQLSL